MHKSRAMNPSRRFIPRFNRDFCTGFNFKRSYHEQKNWPVHKHQASNGENDPWLAHCYARICVALWENVVPWNCNLHRENADKVYQALGVRRLSPQKIAIIYHYRAPPQQKWKCDIRLKYNIMINYFLHHGWKSFTSFSPKRWNKHKIQLRYLLMTFAISTMIAENYTKLLHLLSWDTNSTEWNNHAWRVVIRLLFYQ
jgi:hypothetical protein